MTNTVLQIERSDDGVLRLIKNDPETDNGVSLAMIEALQHAIADVEDGTRAVVVDAVGFHAGAVMVRELKPALEDLTRADFELVAQTGQDLGRRIADLPIPVIGVARKGALGGGLELLLRCDFLFCTDGAKFSLPEARFGFVPAWGGTQWGGRLMRYRRAQEFLLLGETFDGKVAAESGLVTRSFATEAALDAHVASVLDQLRRVSPASFRWTKACLRAVWERSFAEGEALERDAEVAAMAGGEFRDALAAAQRGEAFDFVSRQARSKERPACQPRGPTVID